MFVKIFMTGDYKNNINWKKHNITQCSAPKIYSEQSWHGNVWMVKTDMEGFIITMHRDKCEQESPLLSQQGESGHAFLHALCTVKTIVHPC